MGLETVESKYLGGAASMNCGDVTASAVDEEVMQILKESYERAKELLSENREALDKIAAFLIEKETITGKEFMKIFREVKGIPEPEEGEEKEKAQRIGFSGEVPEALAAPKAEEKRVEEQEETFFEIETPEIFAELSDIEQPKEIELETESSEES